MNKNVFEIKENTVPSGPLVDIYVPDGQQVTLGPSSTRFAFRIQGTQLFLNVTPDYEVQTAGHRRGRGVWQGWPTGSN